MKLLYAIMLASGFHAPAVSAQEAEETPPVPGPALECEEALTVFQDVSGVGRKDRAASKITRKHATMARDGWRFADMEVYTENGDLEGFFLSYVRNVDCLAPPDKRG